MSRAVWTRDADGQAWVDEREYQALEARVAELERCELLFIAENTRLRQGLVDVRAWAEVRNHKHIAALCKDALKGKGR